MDFLLFDRGLNDVVVELVCREKSRGLFSEFEFCLVIGVPNLK